MSRSLRSLILFAAIGAIAFVLSACGRKGPLDPPPGGYYLEPGTTTTPVTRRGGQREDSAPVKQEFDDEGHPIAPQGPKKKLPADFLID